MRALVLALLLVSSVTLSSCTTMRDCCECLQQSGAINCEGSPEECVEGCFELCERTQACYCSAARRADCSAECGWPRF